MNYLNIELKPVKQSVVISGYAYRKVGDKLLPDIRLVAKELAEYLLENGFIATHGPTQRLYSDEYEFTFYLNIFKPHRQLP